MLSPPEARYLLAALYKATGSGSMTVQSGCSLFLPLLFHKVQIDDRTGFDVSRDESMAPVFVMDYS